MRALRDALLFGALVTFAYATSQRLGSTRYDPNTHQAIRSAGCGKRSPYSKGSVTAATGVYAGVKWTYRVYVPRSYDENKPMPLIIQHPGWGLNAKSEEAGCGIKLYADKLGFISVTAQGMNDNDHYGGPWYSWNAAGTTQSPGPGGPTCTTSASTSSYCYESCGSCRDSPQCWWTTCDETVTPTGTGTKNIGGFIPGLFDTLEDQLCIDTTREFAAGESNGGIMTYQLGVDLSSRLAAIAPQFGSFHRGFNLAPKHGVPVLDLHGSKDTTVPANVSLSGDGYYYTPTTEIFNGNKYSSGWKQANGCAGSLLHWPTKYDGQKDFYCVKEGICSGGDVVRCSWNGGHNWLFNDATANGWLVTDFLLRWAKTSHLGKGKSRGDDEEAWHEGPSMNVTVLEADPTPETDYNLTMMMKRGAHGSHYGDPENGCRHDEDVLFAGTGRVCAPRIGSAVSSGADRIPTPKCKLGGATPSWNGCPMDAQVNHHSRAWPICLAKDNSTDPYRDGSFHCLLVCPCSGHGNDCGHHAHSHCPQGAKCERGELRNMGYGVCTYHSKEESKI